MAEMMRNRATDRSSFAGLSMADSLLVLAHELRNPLSLVRTEAAMLGRASTRNDSIGDACERIDRQVTQLDALINDLVMIASNGVARPTVAARAVDLCELLAALATGIRGLSDPRQISVSLDCGVEPLVVLGDEVRLTQALTNVLTNAVKYSERGGRVAIVATRTEAEIHLRIRDTGRGIPPELLDAVFEPFVRGADTDVEGLGVGLAVARRIIEAHGGTLTARSDGSGCGSEFTIRLARSMAVVPRAATRAAAPAVTPRRRVLIVDDYESGARSLARLLSVAGHDVAVAIDGHAGIAEAGRFRPDIVILDLILPDATGREVARKIRGASRPLIVSLSGAEARSDGAKDDSPDDFDEQLAKPFDLDRLLTIVAECRAHVGTKAS